MDILAGEHKFAFNEQVVLTTRFYNRGDSDVYSAQELKFGHHVTLEFLCDVFTPENLRKLADELENYQ